MSGEVDSYGFGSTVLDARQARRAAVHIADRIGAEHPDPRDDLMPRLAGRQLAHNPAVRADVLELLDAVFGTHTSQHLNQGETT